MEVLLEIVNSNLDNFHANDIQILVKHNKEDSDQVQTCQLTFTHHISKTGTIVCQIYDTGDILITPSDPLHIPDYHLVNLINQEFYDIELSDMDEVVQYISEIIPKMTNYYVATGDLLEHQS